MKTNRHSRICCAFFALVLGVLTMQTSFGLLAEKESGANKSARANDTARDVDVNKYPTKEQLAAANAAKIEKLDVQWANETGTPSSIRGGNLAQQGSFSGVRKLGVQPGASLQSQAVSVLDNLGKIYGIQDAGIEFSPGSTIDTDTLGFKHVRITQVHEGLRVVGGDLRVHFDSQGTAYQVTGSYIKDVNIGITPRIQADDAVRAAQNDTEARGFASVKLVSTPELVVYARDLAAPVLAYEMIVASMLIRLTHLPPTGSGFPLKPVMFPSARV